ncbi:hypothetical protein [Methylobacterium sp. SyP6R]|uniref:hypothetical protein n=1 Tax=Methylobacterium sp. SyP6R TaxID=2718876 RepID=UPI001F1B508F|nr:hypothetical protein [Methylobacterium sp. SyP6R]MCF4126197.1 hypothetical protein [Methylobacterium sp. SyP6R]
MKIALMGTSLKENEHRMPVHPSHLKDIDAALRSRLTLERGYGSVFGLDSKKIADLGYSFEDRESLLSSCDIAVLPKPMPGDLLALKPGAILWGWLHFVLYGHLADICIARRHTVVTFEGMFETQNMKGIGSKRSRHVFSGNNRLAGYAGILHALSLKGLDGLYGPSQSVVVIGFGSAGQAAIEALLARGFDNITVYTRRPVGEVTERPPGVAFRQIFRDEAHGSCVEPANSNEPLVPFVDVLSTADIIVNCGEQDPEEPLMYVREGDLGAFDHRCLIVDISCDPGMGFYFSRTTSFEHPTYEYGQATICAVDHTPAYLWDAATFQISREVLRYLPIVADGHDAIFHNPVLSNAAEIVRGTVQNKKILTYQKRSTIYPHGRIGE